MAKIMGFLLSMFDTYCNPADLNSNFNLWGSCIREAGLYGSFELAGLLVLSFFILIAIAAGVTAAIVIPAGTIVLFMLYLMTGSQVFYSIFLLGIIVSGLTIGASILRFISRSG